MPDVLLTIPQQRLITETILPRAKVKAPNLEAGQFGVTDAALLLGWAVERLGDEHPAAESLNAAVVAVREQYAAPEVNEQYVEDLTKHLTHACAILQL